MEAQENRREGALEEFLSDLALLIEDTLGVLIDEQSERRSRSATRDSRTRGERPLFTEALSFQFMENILGFIVVTFQSCPCSIMDPRFIALTCTQYLVREPSWHPSIGGAVREQAFVFSFVFPVIFHDFLNNVL